MPSPHFGHALRVLTTWGSPTRPVRSSLSMTQLPSASDTAARIIFSNASGSLAWARPIQSHTSCTLVFFSVGTLSGSWSTPSTLTCSMPDLRARSMTSPWRPFLALTTGAKTDRLALGG